MALAAGVGDGELETSPVGDLVNFTFLLVFGSSLVGKAFQMISKYAIS